ncbi:FAD/NAD(P)-binding oxidoreductase [Geothrix sp. PMB-07]|uniref:NAD(P)/FAD-dependent oxidoreductase n=1 Tax=Geothrix sp. PMB-07 TaxID=3068640 RepID=UPI002740FC51|nr:FAD/NAD(P)-binding oxidoreductase [Geothrix sp. PMB-07]WLT30940.1 FAD/NAD(P)-binding oxidoreductase [Geothrix sp. PMB-07]
MAERLLVVGAGPAGIAAAVSAAKTGMAVTLVDAQPEPGGQIWRGQWGNPVYPSARFWLAALRSSSVCLRMSRRVVAAPASGWLGLTGPTGAERFGYDKLILATGARDRFLPFPGWTLPGVCGAGGLQALEKGGLDVRGKRIVVGGSGPLLLAVATHLRRRGAHILAVAEQASAASLRGLFPELLRRPRLLLQGLPALSLPLQSGAWVTRAAGKHQLREVHLQTPRGLRVLEADFLAVGYGLVPDLELPRLLGCDTTPNGVCVDEGQRTSVPGVFAAGEPTGIGGVDKALAEGRAAGLWAAGLEAEARLLARDIRKGRAWATALASAFALRPELRRLATPETLLCRCEDVPMGDLLPFTQGRDARLHARCGMGRCQGRICGPAAEFLFGWCPGGPRQPLSPTTFADLVGLLSPPEQP